MAVIIRRATRADAAKVAEFVLALFDLHVGWDARRFTQIATLEGAVSYYGDRADHGSVLVAETDGNVVGFAYFEFEPVLYAELATKVLWLHDIYVEPDERGTGVGSRLLSAVKDEAKRLGANKILLSVAIKNQDGQRLFRQEGFETTMHEMMLVVDE
jgi:GNAT superfamily N-acetyltransferase